MVAGAYRDFGGHRMKIEQIRKLCANGALRWTNHIMMRLLQRGIGLFEVKEALICGVENIMTISMPTK